MRGVRRPSHPDGGNGWDRRNPVHALQGNRKLRELLQTAIVMGSVAAATYGLFRPVQGGVAHQRDGAPPVGNCIVDSIDPLRTLAVSRVLNARDALAGVQGRVVRTAGRGCLKQMENAFEQDLGLLGQRDLLPLRVVDVLQSGRHQAQVSVGYSRDHGGVRAK